MRLKLGRLVALFLLATIVSVTPAFAEGCENCRSYSYGNSAAVFCANTPDGEMGNLDCEVDCYSSADLMYCSCWEAGQWCMVIFVEG